MINAARLELAREPLWWSLFGAFISMFIFVVSINIIADAVRDIYDPKTIVNDMLELKADVTITMPTETLYLSMI